VSRARLVCVLAALAVAAPAAAQSRFEVGAGLSWTAGFDAGGRDALLTSGTGSSSFTLFDTASRVNAAPGATLTLGLFLTRRLAIEGTAEYSRPTLQTTISSDVEGATGTTAESRLTSLVIGGSARYHFGATRLRPFVFGGAGWLRQLDEDNVLLVTGPELHGGGGVSYRVDRHFWLRGQGGVSLREKTIAFESQRRTLAVFAASLLYRF
jgi:outer membrane protein with beta-barrel domain